jgi:uncharacterized membrane protein HdeD (DUF308 family)
MKVTARPDSSSNRTRARLMTAAAILIILLAGAGALLPLTDEVPGANVIGSLLLAAGVIELLAGTQRRQTKYLCVSAGAVTALAGLLLVFRPVTHIFPTTYLVVLWLVVRGLVLGASITYTSGAVRMWTFVSAATDLALALILLTGISIATLIVGLFGPTPEIIASFSWVLAFSFLVTGLWMLATASCERDHAPDAERS